MADTKALLRLAVPDVDVDDALAVLKEHGLEPTYSDAAIAALVKAENVLVAKAVKLKLDEAPRSKRREVKLAVDRLVNARALLYRLRTPQPGDVVVSVGG